MIAVVGAGVAGRATARYLARLGHDVTVIDDGSARKTASGVPQAIINPHRGRRAIADPRDLAGLCVLERVCGELEDCGHNSGYRPTGIIRIARDAAQAERWHHREPQRFFGARDVPRVFDLEVRAPFGGLRFEQGGVIDTQMFLNALLADARERGAKHFCDVLVTSVERTHSPRPWRLHTSIGHLDFQAVIICEGARRPPLAITSQARRVFGATIHLNWPHPIRYDASVPPLIGDAYVGFAPDGIQVGGLHASHLLDLEVAKNDLLNTGASMLPALEMSHCLSLFSAVRLSLPDNQPRVENPAAGLFVVTSLGGRGYLAAPRLAQEVATVLEQSA